MEKILDYEKEDFGDISADDRLLYLVAQPITNQDYEARVHKMAKTLNWLATSPEAMFKHLYEHLHPQVLLMQGIPRYDLDAIKVRNINPEKIFRRIEGLIEKNCGYSYMQNYMQMLVKVLLYMEQIGLGSPDWEKIKALYPEAPTVTLDCEEDDVDLPLKHYHPNAHLIAPPVEAVLGVIRGALHSTFEYFDYCFTVAGID